MIRKHYVFHGRVQGVGFRFTLYQVAHRLGLTGWVRNCYQGNVEACLQGEQRQIDQAIDMLNENRFIVIEHMDIEDVEELLDETSFEIRY